MFFWSLRLTGSSLKEFFTPIPSIWVCHFGDLNNFHQIHDKKENSWFFCCCVQCYIIHCQIRVKNVNSMVLCMLRIELGSSLWWYHSSTTKFLISSFMQSSQKRNFSRVCLEGAYRYMMPEVNHGTLYYEKVGKISRRLKKELAIPIWLLYLDIFYPWILWPHL